MGRGDDGAGQECGPGGTRGTDGRDRSAPYLLLTLGFSNTAPFSAAGSTRSPSRPTTAPRKPLATAESPVEEIGGHAAPAPRLPLPPAPAPPPRRVPAGCALSPLSAPLHPLWFDESLGSGTAPLPAHGGSARAHLPGTGSRDPAGSAAGSRPAPAVPEGQTDTQRGP
ncbi:skin secretory protein xP2-like [Zonotrichia leucophrys gambelii]|uniref:skin secretory protein xP2-like n=1 Tax=Zonotrichia leucophrys gambelii TaxID=257770 RepID=UPI003140863C